MGQNLNGWISRVKLFKIVNSIRFFAIFNDYNIKRITKWVTPLFKNRWVSLEENARWQDYIMKEDPIFHTSSLWYRFEMVHSQHEYMRCSIFKFAMRIKKGTDIEMTVWPSLDNVDNAIRILLTRTIFHQTSKFGLYMLAIQPIQRWSDLQYWSDLQLGEISTFLCIFN